MNHVRQGFGLAVGCLLAGLVVAIILWVLAALAVIGSTAR